MGLLHGDTVDENEPKDKRINSWDNICILIETINPLWILAFDISRACKMSFNFSIYIIFVILIMFPYIFNINNNLFQASHE